MFRDFVRDNCYNLLQEYYNFSLYPPDKHIGSPLGFYERYETKKVLGSYIYISRIGADVLRHNTCS